MDEIKFYLLTLAAGIIAVIMPNAHAEPVADSLTLKPYLGVDMQRRFTGHYEGAGANLYEKKLFSQHAFLGVKLSDYLGVETGYHKGKTKQNVVNNGGLSHEGHHFGVVGYLPLFNNSGFELLGGFGVAFLTATYSHDMPNSAKHAHRKSMSRAMVGAHIPLTQTWKIRGSLIWENSKKMQFQNPLCCRDTVSGMKPLDTWTMGVGLVHEF